MKAFILTVDGQRIEAIPQGKKFTFEEIKPLLGMTPDSMLQYVPLLSKKMELWCDEEGMFKDYKRNDLATMYCALDAVQGPDGTMGNVLICSPGMVD